MNNTKRLALLVCLVFLVLWRATAQSQDSQEQPCRLIAQALEAAKKLKPGMLRADIEKDFQLDGGVSFRTQGRYLFRKCPYIKIDVNFDLEGATETPILSPKDRIASVSRPYLEYPFAD
ncbi:MAG TPA: hypothetical protein VLE48_07340 [Terriglobales bacterium]|nr:hypothetical protein [Terriglobales bacterium]